VNPADIFHFGFLVADLSRAMRDWSSLQEVSWAEPAEVPNQQVWTPAEGKLSVPLRFVYSTGGPVHVELVEGPAGSIWDCSQGPGIHHFGVWVNDISVQTQDLLDRGATLLAAARPPTEGYGNFTYLEVPAAGVIELVSLDIRPRMEAWWSGAAFA